MTAMTATARPAVTNGAFFHRMARGTGTTPGVQALQKAVARMPDRQQAAPARGTPTVVAVPPAWRPQG